MQSIEELMKKNIRNNTLSMLNAGNRIGEAILETLPFAIMIFDSELNIFRGNLRLKNSLNLSSLQLNRKRVCELIPEFKSINQLDQKSELVIGRWIIQALTKVDEVNLYIAHESGVSK